MNELEKVINQKKKLDAKLEGYKGKKVRVYFDEDYTIGEIQSINEKFNTAHVHLVELPEVFDDYTNNWMGHPLVMYNISELKFIE